jgi:hypothetical protein
MPDVLIMPTQIMCDDRLTFRHIKVLMAIFSWRKANTNLARVSRDMLSERSGFPLTRISTITTELEELGWIKKTGNGGKSQWSEYRVRELKNFKKKDKPNGNQNSNDTVTKTVTLGVTKTVTGIDTERTKDRESTERVRGLLISERVRGLLI